MPRRELDDWFWQVGTELQRLSDEVFRSGPTISSRRFWEPRIDVFESAEAIYLKAEVAGVRAEDIQLLYVPERHTIMVRGIRHDGDLSEESRANCLQLEIFYGEFEREISLPDEPIDSQKIRASYRNGFLVVVIPKAAGREVFKNLSVRKV